MSCEMASPSRAGTSGRSSLEPGSRDTDLLAIEVERHGGLEGHRSREELEAEDAERVEIELGGHALHDVARERLGRHVLERPGHALVPGAVGVRQDQAEVHEDDAAAGSDHDVARLHVAVREAGAMHDAERIGHRDEQIERLGDRHALASLSAVLEHPVEAEAPHALEHEEPDALVLAHGVHRHHARMMDRRERPPLPQEVVRCDVRTDDLEGDVAIEHAIVGVVDLAHAAGAEDGLDLVRVADDLADREHGGLAERGRRVRSRARRHLRSLAARCASSRAWPTATPRRPRAVASGLQAAARRVSSMSAASDAQRGKPVRGRGAAELVGRNAQLLPRARRQETLEVRYLCRQATRELGLREGEQLVDASALAHRTEDSPYPARARISRTRRGRSATSKGLGMTPMAPSATRRSGLVGAGRRREEHDRDGPTGGELAQGLEGRRPVGAGHGDVEQDDVRRLAGRPRRGPPPPRRQRHAEAADALERERRHAADVGVVVDDEDARCPHQVWEVTTGPSWGTTGVGHSRPRPIASRDDLLTISLHLRGTRL